MRSRTYSPGVHRRNNKGVVQSEYIVKFTTRALGAIICTQRLLNHHVSVRGFPCMPSLGFQNNYSTNFTSWQESSIICAAQGHILLASK